MLYDQIISPVTGSLSQPSPSTSSSSGISGRFGSSTAGGLGLVMLDESDELPSYQFHSTSLSPVVPPLSGLTSSIEGVEEGLSELEGL